MFGLGLAAAATGQVLVTNDIASSTTWTANNVYNLQNQIYVLPGATLTIEAGTLIASTTNLGGSLAVTRGAQIFVNGTESNPVIFTSQADVATWTGGNPKTGTWRSGANEWGNLTVMGSAYISENVIVANTAFPSASNIAPMEGLVASGPTDTRNLYGGGNDDDDSGTIKYASFRYGGKVIGLNNELNGLSLGGIGRATDVHHIDIMNNVDDGIEIWGGTVNIKNFSIWNVGDDSLDIDQGYRGKIQFGLIVMGYSAAAAQGSGVGDNSVEIDGAEQSNYQPCTTTSMYNLTIVGQPQGSLGSDHTLAFRDNANAQFRNCIFMDTGEQVVRNDNVDGDGGAGYGTPGTLTFAQRWTTAANTTQALNLGAVNPATFYAAQEANGNLIEVKDSVMFRNTFASAYTEANARGVFNVANNNVQIVSILDVDSPIQALTRGAQVNPFGTLLMKPVIYLDPRPKNAALASVAWAPNDGFFSSAHYRGAFAPGNLWTAGWTSATAYGYMPNEPWCDIGGDLAGTFGAPVLSGTGPLTAGSPFVITVSNAVANSLCYVVAGIQKINLPLGNGVVVPDFNSGAGGLLIPIFTDPSGTAVVGGTWPALPPGFTIYLQVGVGDVNGTFGAALTNALAATSQ